MQAATIPIRGLAQCKITIQKGEVSLGDLPLSFSFKASMKVRTIFVSLNYQPRLLGTNVFSRDHQPNPYIEGIMSARRH